MMNNGKDIEGLVLFMSLYLTAVVGRMLKSTEKISPKHFAGEVLVSVAMAYASWHFGLWQNWTYSQIVFYGLFSALGQIQLLKFVAQQFGKTRS